MKFLAGLVCIISLILAIFSFCSIFPLLVTNDTARNLIIEIGKTLYYGSTFVIGLFYFLEN
jgi:hypothetical protein